MSEVRKTWLLGWPIMGSQLLWLSMTVVDNMLVGRLGEEPLAALAMASTLVGFANVSVVGLLSALSPLVSHAFGAGRSEEIGRIIRQGLRIAAATSCLALLLFIMGPEILEALGQDPRLTPIAGEYLLSVAWGLPAIVTFSTLRHLSEATSDPKPSVVIAFIASAMNVVLDLALIQGLWGFPALGVAGAGYATAGVQWFMAFALVAYLRLNKRYEPYGLFRGPFRADWEMLRELLRLGVPMAGTLLSEMSFFIGTTLLVGLIGTQALAAHQIALNAASFTFMIPLGLSFAVSIRIGQAAGRNLPSGVRSAGHAGMALTTFMAMGTASAFLIFPRAIAGLYTKDPQLIDTAVTLIRIAGVFQLFDGLQVLGMGMLRGLKDTRVPFVATVFSFWVCGLPICLTLGFGLELGARGIWYGMLTGLGLAAAAHQWRFAYLTRRPRPEGGPALRSG